MYTKTEEKFFELFYSILFITSILLKLVVDSDKIRNRWHYVCACSCSLH